MTPLIFVYWGAYGAEIIPATNDTGGWVPEDEVWWLQSASISIEVPNGQPQLPPADYVLHDDTRHEPTGGLWYMTALAKATATNTTPVLALNRPYLLMPGHRLNARTNLDMPSYARMGIFATGLKFPIADLPKLLGMASSVEQAPTGPSPDFSAAIAAAQQAAQALTSFAVSLP